jgi:hypothetical protein
LGGRGFQHGDGLVGERHAVLALALHAASGHRPHLGLEIDLGAPTLDHLRGARGRERQEFQGQSGAFLAPAVTHAAHELAHHAPR